MTDSSPDLLNRDRAAGGEATPSVLCSPLVAPNLPRQRWRQPTANPELAAALTQATGLSPLLTQVLINRGITTAEQAADFLDPERLRLPSPLEEFPDLGVSLELLVDAIENQRAIAICGDYDADGMTSTALLMRALTLLGATVTYIIPSRMAEGYGINQRIVEDCHAAGVSLILTVDNGIAARLPIERARQLGLAVIVTDHHDIPPELPPANAILNPKLLPETSPYRGVAGVGVAYILAICLAQTLDQTQDLTGPLLELFTLGTIADLAPLTGVNRRWVRRGLGLLPRSRLLGIQALIQVAGLADQSKPLKPEHIGFRLGPRINAVGRISDPQIVIDMLTTDDVGVALERAMQCEQINATRQELCQSIEAAAVAWCEQQQQSGAVDLHRDRVLVVVQPDWHHGVIGIVASRLVERYGVPVFIGTYEDAEQKVIRGSARGIPEFDVFAALQACADLMEKFGGHRAAGGFSFLTKHLRQVKSRLAHYACGQLSVDLLKPLIKLDVQASLGEINHILYEQIDHLHPCGIENPDPVFWTPNVQVVDQQTVGRNRDHLKLVLSTGGGATIKAIAWRWGEYYPLPGRLDVAYKLKQNEWQGVSTIELELVGVRLPEHAVPAIAPGQVDQVAAQIPGAPSKSRPPKSVAAEPRIPKRLAPGHAGPEPVNQASPPPVPSDLDSDPKGSGSVADPPSAICSPDFDLPIIPASSLAVAPSSQGRMSRVEKSSSPSGTKPSSPGLTATLGAAPPEGVEFFYSNRRYWATLAAEEATRQLTIGNPEGQLLVVSLAERQGFLYLPGQAPRPIDVAEAFYFNLIRAGLTAVELAQMTQLLLEKDQRLADQDGQIQTLSRQVARLEQQLKALQHGVEPPSAIYTQAPPGQNDTSTRLPRRSSPQPGLDAAEIGVGARPKGPSSSPQPVTSVNGVEPLPSGVDPQKNRQQVRQAVGDSAWFCLAPATQNDLYTAFEHQQRLEARGAIPGADYAEAGVRLISAVEREILQPLVEGLTQYSIEVEDEDLGALAQGLSCQPSLGALPPLLAETWKQLSPQALKADVKPRRALYQTVAAEDWAGYPNPVDETHRVLLDEFLQGWEHPMARWLTTANGNAAADLAQVHQLHQIAADPERPLPLWQHRLLKKLVLGEGKTKGLFQNVFGGAT